MPKVIVVAGTHNTGKTSSIRKFLETRRIVHRKRGDILLIFPTKKANQQLVIGATSGGDNLTVISANIHFLRPRKCDVMVMASKSTGSTLGALTRFAKSMKASLILIPTKRVSGAAAIAREIARVARAIERNVR
jgi:hypothetical protein